MTDLPRHSVWQLPVFKNVSLSKSVARQLVSLTWKSRSFGLIVPRFTASAANQHINQSLNSIGRFASNTVPRRIAMRRNSTFWRDSCRKHVASVRGEWWQTVCCLVPPARITSRELVRELEADLATFADQRMSQVRFRNETANLLGPLQFDDEARQRYLEIVNELFGADQSPVLDSQRMDLITAKWRGWMSGLARHRGNNLEKQILDAISYESRAAIHCCYSTVWCCLLPRLARTYRFPEESFRFHQFWHLDHCRKSNDENDLFHLFHGHVFALHPALGQFLRTTTGPRLMASWLRNPESEEDYQRLLNGLFVAIGQYDRWRESIATSRKSASGARYARRVQERHESERGRHRR